MSALDDTVSSLIPEWPEIEMAQRAAIAARCAALVRQQISLAPFHIRFGFYILFEIYRFFALVRAGFNPTGSARAKALSEFSAVPVPFFFGVERVLRSTALLYYFEQPEVLSALGEETIAERQATFRARRNSKDPVGEPQ